MRFQYTGGEYIQFRGYMFAFGHPVTIMDKATEEALIKRSDFRRIEDGEVKEGRQGEGRKEGLLATPELVPDEDIPPDVLDACPKCGKVVKQGKYMHQKYCRGK